MTTLPDVDAWLADRLPALLEKCGVPGAAAAVLHGGEVVDAAAGTLSKSTGVDATPESVFQIGSITKLWTSTLVMQLVDEGRVDLDLPVRTYLPDLLDRVLSGRIDPGLVFDLTLPLDDVAEGYKAMDERRAIKVLLRP